jgi:hypothetical protein
LNLSVLAVLRKGKSPPSLAQATATENGEAILSLLQPQRESLVPHFLGGPVIGLLLIGMGVWTGQWMAVALGAIFVAVVPMMAAYDWASTELVATSSGLYIREGLHGPKVRHVRWQDIQAFAVDAKAFGNLWTFNLADEEIRIGGMPPEETLVDALEAHWMPIAEARAAEDAKMANL